MRAKVEMYNVRLLCFLCFDVRPQANMMQDEQKVRCSVIGAVPVDPIKESALLIAQLDAMI